MAAKHPLSEGDLLNDRYQLVSPLARGGMATVWRARDRFLGRDVAVKTLDPRLRGDADAGARLHIEAQALAQLSHPHIAALHDVGAYGADPRTPFLVMELVEGTPLSAVIGRVPRQAATQIVAQVADALAAAHARGIVHRDVTAANVLLTPHGVKLIDFGICALSGDNDTADDSRLMGTTAYLAPERLDGAPVDTAVDVYALGVLAHLALTGGLPWPNPGQSNEDIDSVRHRRAPESIDTPGIPAEVGDICLRCLAGNARQRPTAAQVSAALRPFAVPEKEIWHEVIDQAAADRGMPVTFTGPTEVKALRRQHQSRRPRGRRTAAAAAGIIAIAAIAWSATGWTPTPTAPPQAIGPAIAPAAPPDPAELDCHVGFEVTQTGTSGFTATVTVTNLGAEPIPPGWRLHFALPQEQWIDHARSDAWSQEGAAVTSGPGDAPLAAGVPVRLTLSGTYVTNALPPGHFRLNERMCAATVVNTTPQANTLPVVATTRKTGTGNGTGQTAAVAAAKPDKGTKPDSAARPGNGRRP